jgi:SOS-response transcriptional repressor LexA
VRLPNWARESDRFVLSEVCGDSLSGAGVYDGDYALIHLTREIQDGDLVACLVPSGMVIKFLRYEPNGTITLLSANSNYPSLSFEASDVLIQGKVIRTERDW